MDRNRNENGCANGLCSSSNMEQTQTSASKWSGCTHSERKTSEREREHKDNGKTSLPRNYLQYPMSTIFAHMRTQIFATSKRPDTLHIALFYNQYDFGQHKQHKLACIDQRFAHSHVACSNWNGNGQQDTQVVRAKRQTKRTQLHTLPPPPLPPSIQHNNPLHAYVLRYVPEHPRNPQHTFDLGMVHASSYGQGWSCGQMRQEQRVQPRQPQCHITSCSLVIVSICLNKCGRCSKAHNRRHRTTTALCSADCVECAYNCVYVLQFQGVVYVRSS